MNEVDKVHLLEAARASLEAYFDNSDIDLDDIKHLTRKKPVFVRLFKKGELRGGMGLLEPEMPLYEAVLACTRKAAFEDPRQQPIEEKELKSVKIEISVIEDFEVLVGDEEDYAEQIEIGKHGLKIAGIGNALLLPRVAKDRMYTPVQFLNAVAQAAGLSFNAWKDSKNKLFRFTSQTFSE